jgi:hypothetical protein
MKAWLLEGNILFCDNMVEDHLFDLITLNKPKHKSYVTDHPYLNSNSSNKTHTAVKIKDVEQLLPHRYKETG